jgi:hypothetical protein
LLAGTAVVAAVAASVGGPWYARAAWHRGNPVYPFFDRHLGGQAPDAMPASKTPLSWHPGDIVSAPWRVTMTPDRFGGRGHQLGPLFLMVLPGLLCVRRLRGLGSLLGIAAVYALLWYTLRQNVRFLLPAVPLACVGAAWVLVELARFPRAARWAALAPIACVLAMGVAAPLKRACDKAPVALGLESRDAFLTRSEPTWKAAATANQFAHSRPRILSQDYRAFYFQGHVTRESLYRRRTGYDRRVRGPGDLSRGLRAEGFTHLLLAQVGPAEEGGAAQAARGVAHDGTLARLVDGQQAAEAALPPSARSLAVLAAYDFCDSDGFRRRYRLVELR